MAVIIGLCGRKRSGKDTVSAMIKSAFELDCIKTLNLRFADPLKEIVIPAFMPIVPGVPGMNDQLDSTLKNRTIPVHAWNIRLLINRVSKALTALDMPPLTEDEKLKLFLLEGLPTNEAYRKALQLIGTDVFRKRNPNVWINITSIRLDIAEATYHVITISDVRMRNEAEFIRERGGLLFKIEKTWDTDSDDHITEREVDTIKVDHVFSPEYGLEHLAKVAEEIRKIVLSRCIQNLVPA